MAFQHNIVKITAARIQAVGIERKRDRESLGGKFHLGALENGLHFLNGFKGARVHFQIIYHRFRCPIILGSRVQAGEMSRQPIGAETNAARCRFTHIANCRLYLFQRFFPDLNTGIREKFVYHNLRIAELHRSRQRNAQGDLRMGQTRYLNIGECDGILRGNVRIARTARVGRVALTAGVTRITWVVGIAWVIGVDGRIGLHLGGIRSPLQGLIWRTG